MVIGIKNWRKIKARITVLSDGAIKEKPFNEKNLWQKIDSKAGENACFNKAVVLTIVQRRKKQMKTIRVLLRVFKVIS